MKEVETRTKAKSKFGCLCLYCNQPMDVGNVQQGYMHISCFETDVPVIKWRMYKCNWIVQTPEEFKESFYDSMLVEIESNSEGCDEQTFEVIPTHMKAGKFYHLPEFTGF